MTGTEAADRVALVDVHAHFVTDDYVAAARRPAMNTRTGCRAGRPGRRRNICG